jgi:hypothetical protein
MKQFLFGLVALLLVSTVPIVSFGSHDTQIVKVSDGDHLTALVDHSVITPVISVNNFELIAPHDVGWFDTKSVSTVNTMDTVTAEDPVDWGISLWILISYTQSITQTSGSNLASQCSTTLMQASSTPVYKTFDVLFNKLE